MRRFCPHMRFGVTFVAVFMFEAEHVSRSKTNSPQSAFQNLVADSGRSVYFGSSRPLAVRVSP